MADRPIKFGQFDGDSVRARMLNALAGRVHTAEQDIDQLEDQIGAVAEQQGGAAFDPGDLRVYYENGKV